MSLTERMLARSEVVRRYETFDDKLINLEPRGDETMSERVMALGIPLFVSYTGDLQVRVDN